MPMDDNEKKELVKKIMEQRRAMWSGEATTDRKQRQPNPPSRQNDPTAGIPPSKRTSDEIPVNITEEDSFRDSENHDLNKKKPKPLQKTKSKEDEKISFKVIFSAVSILIIALLTGIIIGYLLTILDFSNKL